MTSVRSIQLLLVALALAVGFNPARNIQVSPKSQVRLAELAAGSFASQTGLFDFLANVNVTRLGYEGIFASVPVVTGAVYGPTEPCYTFATCTVISAPGVSTNLANGVVMYYHGGGYIAGTLSMYGNAIAALSRDIKYPIVYVNYRLAPENVLPAAVIDAVQAYDWLRASPRNVPANKIAFMGDSAGGGLTVLALQQLLRTAGPQPACAVLMSPYSDLSQSGDSHSAIAPFDDALSTNALNTRLGSLAAGGLTPLRNPRVNGVFGQFEGMTKLYVMVGASERLLSDSITIASNARSSGVQDVILDIQSMMYHVYPLFDTPESYLGRIRIKKYLKQKCFLVPASEQTPDESSD